jgi:O-antigen/teichoic acid export membrane protein
MLKKLLAQTLSYGMSTVIARLINYLIVPLHTGFFAATNYGSLSLFYAYLVIFNSVYSYGMETAFFRLSVDTNHSQRNAQTLLILTTVLFTAFGLWLSQSWAYWWYMLLILAFDTLSLIPFASLRLQNKVYWFSTLKILNVLLTLLLNILYFWTGLLQDRFDPIEWVLFANLISSALVWLILLPDSLQAGFGINWSLTKKMLSYGWPFLFAGLFFAVNEAGDRLMLEWWSLGNAKKEIGIYSACYKLSIFISLAVQAYKFAAEPLFFSAWGQKELYSRSMSLFVAVCAAMMLLVSANTFWLAQILIRKAEYHEGLAVVPVLLLANIALGMYYNFSVWYKLSDKTYFAAWIGFCGAVITIAMNFWLIPKLGYFGSSLSTLACYTGMAGLCYYYGQLYYPIAYQTKKIMLYLLTGFVFSLLAFRMGIWGNVLVLIYGFLVWKMEHKALKKEFLSDKGSKIGS